MPQTGKGRGAVRRMPPVLVLLSLLLGSLEVSAAPFEKGVHPEEMVTRCIVEVLSNALAKPNAPAIDPECKEILRKNSRYGTNEAENEQRQYDTRNLKDYASDGKHQYDSIEEIKRSAHLLKEENEKRHPVDNENREESEEERLMKLADEKEESVGHSKERHLADEEDDDEDNEKRGDHKDHNEKGEMINKDKYLHEASREPEHNDFDKKGHHSAKSEEESSQENDEDPRNLEEIKRQFVSQSPKEKLFHPDKHNSAHSNEGSEESDEREDKKRSYKPMHDNYGQRFLGYEEKRSHLEQGNHIAFDRGQNSHHDQNSLENALKMTTYDKRPHSEKESSEESKEKIPRHQGSEEEEEAEREQHYSRDKSNEKELNGHHYEEKRYREERKHWPSQQNVRLNYEESHEDSKESEEDIDRFHERDRLDKEKFYRKLRHLQDIEEDESDKQEKKKEDKRHYIGEEMVDEMKRYYPEFSHEKDLTHYNDEDSEEVNNPDNEKNKRHHSEEERLLHKYGLSGDPIRWKSRYFENHDTSKEERKRSFQKMFPDYGDYDLWGKRQLLEDMNHDYVEKRSPLKFHKFEEKRQQDRMDELAQLLNYKKKSVEFPDFYDSAEIKKRHYNDRLSQRPLTEEEEKELKNLAIMDMELQKIAEKLSNNRQG